MPGIAGGDEGEFVLRVKGDSMKDAGILEGDHVVVRRQETAANGEIVVALVGDERGDRQALLQGGGPRPPAARERCPASRSWSRDVEVLGRVVGVCRRVT